jgi:hypothetical protein
MKPLKALLILLHLFAFSFWSDVQAQPIRLINLKTEYTSVPLGIDVARPRFSWQMASELPGCYQTAFQIIVTDEAGNTVWNSGKKRESGSLNISYDKFSPIAFTKNSAINLFSCNSASVWKKFGVTMTLSEAMGFANSKGNTVFSLTNSVPQAKVTGLIGQFQYGPVRSGLLPAPGHTGGNYSPRINGSKESPAIQVTGQNGTV